MRRFSRDDALSFVLSLSFFPPKESYSVVQDAEERREKGVTMNSILNSLFTVLIGFFFSRVFEEATVLAHKSEREHRKRAEKRKREFEKKSNTNTDTQEKENFSHVFGRKKNASNYTNHFSQNIREYLLLR